jgi:anion-transporting  ArsA/GET3 family ATPase
MTTSQSRQSLSNFIENHRVFIHCGTGGVGKTTVSCAVALYAAIELGKKALVITIDPAKRLKTALGFEEWHSSLVDLSDRLPKGAKGQFFALMPQSADSFRHLVEDLTDSPTEQARLAENRILKSFSKEYSGANEYFALNELYRIYKEGQFDFIVLDTPPSRNTVSFLKAPRTLSRFFEEKLIKILVLPTHSFFSFGFKKLFSVLGKVTGEGFIQKLFDFGETLITVQDSFLSRLKEIHRFLQSKDVSFFLVCAPVPEIVPELETFFGEIQEQRYAFNGIFFNRSLSHLQTEPESLKFDDCFVREVQKRESLVKTGLEGILKNQFIFQRALPELNRDIQGIEDLLHVVHHLKQLDRN